MAHRSRGCLRCRQRRVKCDQGRPACQRCITRDELCVGYRDELDLFFLDQTDKVVSKSLTISSDSSVSSLSPPSQRLRARSKSLEQIRTPSDSGSAATNSNSEHLPWLKGSGEAPPDVKQEAVSKFMEEYVLYPCSDSSSPGFLEHLPSLFKEVNVNGRFALRWAVEAAALADYASTKNDQETRDKAFDSYGRSLAALGKSLSEKGKAPDDYDLMTVVILDIFETLFIQDERYLGSHSQGMAHILRLRGHDQFHDARGWGLFRLAHHRLQKEKLAKQLSPMRESQTWLDNLNTEMSFVQLEKGALDVNSICERARSLLSKLHQSPSSWEDIVQLVRDMMAIDEENAQWRERPEWSFKTLHKSELFGDPNSIDHLPEIIELHKDVWMAYEWNYHRTARIILHQTLLDCLLQPSSDLPPTVSSHEISKYAEESLAIIHGLADQVLSTVPQILGDINSLGQCRPKNSDQPSCQAIGGYLLLWPIKIIKSQQSMTTEKQKQEANRIFERIRDRTGMKSNLGSLSCI